MVEVPLSALHIVVPLTFTSLWSLHFTQRNKKKIAQDFTATIRQILNKTIQFP